MKKEKAVSQIRFKEHLLGELCLAQGRPGIYLVFMLDWMRLSHTKQGSLHCLTSTGLSVHLSHKYSHRNIQYNSWPNIGALVGVSTELLITGVSTEDRKGCSMQAMLRLAYKKGKEIQPARSHRLPCDLP